MTRKNKILIAIIIILGIIILALTVVAPILQNKANPENTNSSVNNSNSNFAGFNASANIAVPGSTPAIVTKEPSTQSVLEALAKTFAEKFGSFSNQANYENLIDAKFYMTEDMKQWTDKYISDNAKKKIDEFYGVSTRALKAEIITMNNEETQAQVVVTVQREEQAGDSLNKNITYPKLVLDFMKIDNAWKVNSANWK